MPAQSTHSLSFDGTNDYVTFGNVAVGGLTTISVSLWLKATQTTSVSFGLASRILSKGDGDPLTLGFNGGQVQFVINGFGGPQTTGFSTGAWHHLLAVFVSGSAWKLYLDGVQDGSSSGSATLDTNSRPLILGASLDAGGASTGREFDGLIDDVFVWSADQSSHAAALAAGSLDPSTLTTGLIAQWRLEEGTGTTTSDGSGNGYTGTLTNGPAWSTDVPAALAGGGGGGGHGLFFPLANLTGLGAGGPFYRNPLG